MTGSACGKSRFPACSWLSPPGRWSSRLLELQKLYFRPVDQIAQPREDRWSIGMSVGGSCDVTRALEDIPFLPGVASTWKRSRSGVQRPVSPNTMLPSGYWFRPFSVVVRRSPSPSMPSKVGIVVRAHPRHLRRTIWGRHVWVDGVEAQDVHFPKTLAVICEQVHMVPLFHLPFIVMVSVVRAISVDCELRNTTR